VRSASIIIYHVQLVHLLTIKLGRGAENSMIQQRKPTSQQFSLVCPENSTIQHGKSTNQQFSFVCPENSMIQHGKSTSQQFSLVCEHGTEMNLLTPCSRILIEKLAVPQLVKKFPSFHRTHKPSLRSQGPAICP
jgi:hypothetical protein